MAQERRIRFQLSIGYANADHEEDFYFDNDTDDDAIEEAFTDWRDNHIDSSWYEMDKED